MAESVCTDRGATAAEQRVPCNEWLPQCRRRGHTTRRVNVWRTVSGPIDDNTAVGDFPCWSKSYLRFGLNDIPPGKVILSATLALHLWGNAGYVPSQAPPSYTHLFTVAEEWDEHTIVWNNAPMAKENLTAIWVYPRTDQGPDFPGIPYTWDATQAVAEAYAADKPLNIAFYTSDTNFDSGKYYISSDDEHPLASPRCVAESGRPPSPLGVGR